MHHSPSSWPGLTRPSMPWRCHATNIAPVPNGMAWIARSSRGDDGAGLEHAAYFARDQFSERQMSPPSTQPESSSVSPFAFSLPVYVLPEV